ncbi:MAG: ExbD/TolR family protein [Flavobacteriaceae bacterium]|jgi:biopolymer transport protein ExbD
MNLRGRNKITPEFNMSSMTDVVFLLLIFFMIASTLAKQLNSIEVQLPQAKGKTENRTAVAVSINDNKRFYVDEQAVTKGRLQQVLLERLQTTAQPSIVLRAAKTVPVDLVVFVMDIANRNGIEVVLAVESP